jgi:pyruvate dehydrogenase E2 component (dihydrolipoamide acetyltransferase)
MTIEFTLPDIGEGLHEAEIVKWFVAEGDAIVRNEPFVEILTDKANVEMPAPAAGTVRQLGAAPGDIIRVGDLLIVIDDGGGDHDGPSPDASLPEPVNQPNMTTAVAPPPGAGVGRRPKASPATRRLAVELGIDLQLLAGRGSGPGGRILADDVRGAAAEPAPPPVTTPGHAATRPETPVPRSQRSAPPVTSEPATIGQMDAGVHPLRGIRRATAKAMDRSWSTIPHISASNEIDATALLEARRQLRELQPPEAANTTPLVVALVAIARALRRFPVMNASLDLDAETITVHERVNIGIAVATEHGLMVPVIADADRLGVQAMADEVDRLSTAARMRSVSNDDLTGGTHTVTNYGSAGTHLAAPIIRPGEASITGLGSIELRPVVVTDNDSPQVVARPTLPLVVCGDHRLVDGDVMSAFQNDIARSLLAPIGLLL